MHFYKITNKEEKHQNMQYKTGLNVDILPFNPYGDCESGGIYFAKEDILAFLWYGSWIRRVTIPKDARVYENPGSPKKWKADKVILGRKYKITGKVIERLLSEGADPKVDNSSGLRCVLKRNQSEIAKVLLPLRDPNAIDCHSLYLAVVHGHLEIVKLLLPLNKLKNKNKALQIAALNGRLEIVKLLLPLSDLKNRTKALQIAIQNGHTKIIKLLESVNE